MEIRGRVTLVNRRWQGESSEPWRAPCVRPCPGPTDEVGRKLERVSGVAFLHRPPDLARPKRREWQSFTMQLVVRSRSVDTRSAAISPMALSASREAVYINTSTAPDKCI